MEQSALTNMTTYRAGDDSLDHKQDALERLNNASDLQKEAGGFGKDIVGLKANNTARISLLDLPVEVWSLIIGFLPDKKDVRAAVHSSPKLFSLWYVVAPSQ